MQTQSTARSSTQDNSVICQRPEEAKGHSSAATTHQHFLYVLQCKHTQTHACCVTWRFVKISLPWSLCKTQQRFGTHSPRFRPLLYTLPAFSAMDFAIWKKQPRDIDVSPGWKKQLQAHFSGLSQCFRERGSLTGARWRRNSAILPILHVAFRSMRSMKLGCTTIQ